MVRFGKDAMELHDIVVVWSAISNPPKPESSSLSLELKAGWGLLKRRFEIERSVFVIISA